MTDDDELRSRLDELTEHELAIALWKAKWYRQARPKQLPPDHIDPNWKNWGICTGRGFGKTLSGANWIGLEAAQQPNSFNAVIAPTHNDARYVCFEGPTGLLAVIPPALFKPEDYSRSVPELRLWNNAVLRGFAGDSPDRLRGPQHHRAWCEEIAAWMYPDEAWSNMIFGLRLGKLPRVLWTTTPRPTAFMRERIKQKDCIVVTGEIFENRANLPQSTLDEIEQYKGTKIFEQEALGRLIDPEEGGVVKRSQWRIWPRHDPLPHFISIVMSLDTAFTEKSIDRRTKDPDYTACSVWGVFERPEGPDRKLRHAMLLDAWQDHLGFPELISRVKRESAFRYGEADKPAIQPVFGDRPRPTAVGRKIDMIVIEDRGSGTSLRQALAAENIFAHAYNPHNADKLSRLHLVSPLFAHGRVWAVESDRRPNFPKDWADPLITQVCSYTGKGSIAHDDLLDSCTAGLRIIRDHFMPSFTVRPPTRDQVSIRQPRPLINPYAQ